jgi:hypothetical protein
MTNSKMNDDISFYTIFGRMDNYICSLPETSLLKYTLRLRVRDFLKYTPHGGRVIVECGDEFMLVGDNDKVVVHIPIKH